MDYFLIWSDYDGGLQVERFDSTDTALTRYAKLKEENGDYGLNIELIHGKILECVPVQFATKYEVDGVKNIPLDP